MTVNNACDNLYLSKILNNRKGGWYIQRCVFTGQGIIDGFDYLINTIKKTEYEAYFDKNVIHFLINKIWLQKKWVFSLNKLVKKYL